MAQPLGPQILTHGQHIFIYCNIRTNQVLYSLTRSLNVPNPPSIPLSLYPFTPLPLYLLRP